jgi:hypothetical protein
MPLELRYLGVGFAKSNTSILFDSETKDAIIIDAGGDLGLLPVVPSQDSCIIHFLPFALVVQTKYIKLSLKIS